LVQFVHGLFYTAESHVLFKKDVSEPWRRKFPACRLECNKAGKGGASMHECKAEGDCERDGSLPVAENRPLTQQQQ